MANLTTAIILAAGMGTRLKDLGKDAPKGFLRLGKKTIIEESLDKLRSCGISKVILVTGYLSEMYDELAAQSGGFALTVKNPVFADSGSGYSFYAARTMVKPDEDFLLLESDLIYEKRALSVLLEDSRPDIILLSGKTSSGDEVYVETSGGNLVAMAKDKSRLGSKIEGELVGVSKISAKLYVAYCAAVEKLFEKTLKVEYEAGLTETAKTFPIPCRLVPDLAWAEIDDENHLARARDKVYSKTVDK
ncbi:MAG: phosphocholine cytidylyltransferase family protein [Spirochaetales bacterium]|jgi:2-aminoethylphosphonate-pyruvate transaminase|nr:phosphocholine cytidylyltransferase family protein [Spirochaetales bacterium]